MSPSLQHFETFLAVAEEESFTAAANKLGTSKASVSQTIRLLESSLGVTLFIRSTRKITRTDEGNLLLIQCQRLKKELDTARDLVSHFNKSPSGLLRISCNPYFAESHLVKLFKAYMQKCPDVQIEILAEERMPDMLKEQVDIVFGVNWPAPDDVVAKKIGKTRYVLCASPQYLTEYGTPTSIKDLEQHHYIPHSGRQVENKVVNLKQPERLNISPRLISNNAYFMKQCALSSMGIVQLHHYMVEEELSNGTLIEVLSECLNEQVPLYIYYQKHRFVQPKIRQFVNLCQGL